MQIAPAGAERAAQRRQPLRLYPCGRGASAARAGDPRGSVVITHRAEPLGQPRHTLTPSNH